MDTTKLTAAKRTALESAIAGGLDALESFALQVRERRYANAADWTRYQLIRPFGPCMADDYSVISPEGHRYQAEITREGVVRYPAVPDQDFIDALNCALRAHGSSLRVQTKHVTIAQRLRELARFGADYYSAPAEMGVAA